MGVEELLLLLLVDVALDWRLRKGREGTRKVGKGVEGEGMLMGIFCLQWLRYGW